MEELLDSDRLGRRQGSGNTTGRKWNTRTQYEYYDFAELGFVNSDYTADGKRKPGAPPMQLYDLATDIGEASNVYGEHPDIVEMMNRDETLLPHPRRPAEVRRMIADYYRYISYLDMLIGRVFDALEASPYAKNTIVVFSADSGVARGSHGLIGKQNLYEHSIRVPLIIAGPGIPADKRTNAMCDLYDVFPTLGAWCGVSPPPKSEGMDLTATLRDPGHTARPDLLFAYRNVQRVTLLQVLLEKLLSSFPVLGVRESRTAMSIPRDTDEGALDARLSQRGVEQLALVHRQRTVCLLPLDRFEIAAELPATALPARGTLHLV